MTAFLISLPLLGQCTLPEVAPGAVSRLSAAEMVESGHYRDAEAILKPVVAEHPHDGRSAWLLSRAEAGLGRLDEAMKLAEAALAEDSGNAAYHAQVGLVAGMQAEKASIFKQLGLAKKLRQELEAAVALDPGNAEAAWALMLYYNAAPAAMGGGKAKAQQLGEKLEAASKAAGLYYRGRLAAEAKDFDKAESLYRQAAMEKPVYFNAVAEMAKYWMEVKPDENRARRWACRAVHADPTRADAWALLARAYTMCGCWTEAQEAARRAEQIDPANLAPLYGIAAGAEARGEQTELAVTLLRRYLAQPQGGIQPSEAAAHMQLGLALEKLGQPEAALTELKVASEQDSSIEGLKAALKRVGAEAKK